MHLLRKIEKKYFLFFFFFLISSCASYDYGYPVCTNDELKEINKSLPGLQCNKSKLSDNMKTLDPSKFKEVDFDISNEVNKDTCNSIQALSGEGFNLYSDTSGYHLHISKYFLNPTKVITIYKNSLLMNLLGLFDEEFVDLRYDFESLEKIVKATCIKLKGIADNSLVEQRIECLEKSEDGPLFINGVRQDIQPEYVKKRKIELSSCLNDLLYKNDKSRQHYYIKKDYGIKTCKLPEELKFTELKKVHNTVSLSFKCGAKYNTNDAEEFCSSRKGENTESFESCFSKKMKQTLKKSSY